MIFGNVFMGTVCMFGGFCSLRMGRCEHLSVYSVAYTALKQFVFDINHISP